MNIIFVGTGSGKTSLKRYHSSILLNSENYKLLVDAGDGISRALLNAKVEFNSINGILFSHFHPDHFSGLGALIIQMKMFDRKKMLNIFVNKDQVDFVEHYLINSYLLPEKLGFEIIYTPFTDDTEIQVAEGINFIPRKNSHLNELTKFSEYTPLNFFSASFLFRMNEKNILYTADLGNKIDLKLFNDFNLDILISEITHISLDDIIMLIKEKKPEVTYLTHITEENYLCLKDAISLIPDNLKNLIKPAEDGLIVEI